MPKVIGIIPSRFQSTRFPGKPLALIGGLPLIIRVLESARCSNRFTELYVATDDGRIAGVVRDHGGQVIITSADAPTGSDRVAEAAKDIDGDYIVNIQGDEPFLPSEVFERVIDSIREPDVVMSSACSPLTDESDGDNPNVVKVVMDAAGFALYFSRSRIPYQRSQSVDGLRLYRHIGIYGFKRDFLMQFASWPRSPLEIAESLEQLRALEHGHRIKMSIVKSDFAGIDSKEDLIRAEEILSKRER